MSFTVDLWDLAVFAGVWLALIGLNWVHHGLGLVGLGLVLICIGIGGAKRWVSLQRSSAKLAKKTAAETDEV